MLVAGFDWQDSWLNRFLDPLNWMHFPCAIFHWYYCIIAMKWKEFFHFISYEKIRKTFPSQLPLFSFSFLFCFIISSGYRKTPNTKYYESIIFWRIQTMFAIYNNVFRIVLAQTKGFKVGTVRPPLKKPHTLFFHLNIK